MKKVRPIISTIICSLLLIVVTYSLGYKVNSQEESNKFRSFHSSLIEGSENRIIKVAVLDSGIDSKHSYFQNLVIEEHNMINPNQSRSDLLGHGTAIAGIIVNVGHMKNSENNIEFHSVKVLDDKGKGTYADVIKGLEWCIQNDIDLINLSLGFKKNNPLLQDKIKEVIDENILVIASAGNNYGFDIEYPAAYDGVISVSAINEHNKIAEFSAKGIIDFYTNGTNIPILLPNDKHDVKDGSSLATAHITGIVTLIFQKSSDLDFGKPLYSQIMDTLQNVADHNSENQNIIRFSELVY
ncbi:MAG: S8 family serine peptidase [Bacillus sp. (in: firmicutes)]